MAGSSTLSPSLGQLADFVRGPDVPGHVRARCCDLLLDTLGVAAAAADLEPGRIARTLALRTMATADPAEAVPIAFDGRFTSLPGAAFALATQIDNLDAHDGHNPTKGHAGAAVVPALLALVQRYPELDPITTMTIGYEVACRAGIALHASVPEYHTSGAWNCLGVAAMAGHALGFDVKTLRQALGIAEYHGPRSQMMREIATPTMLHDGSSMGAWVGLTSALLAADGFTGAPAITVENAPEVWSDLGTRWMVMEQYIKPFPICRWAHGALAAAQSLIAAGTLHAEHVDRIEIRTFRNAAQLFSAAPDTTSEAQYSLHFAVATMLLRGRIGVAQITGAGLRDPEVHALLPRISVRVDPELEAAYPARRLAGLRLTLRDGRVRDSGVHDAPGRWDAPWSRHQIRDKFMAYATPPLGQDRAAALSDVILSLDRAPLPPAAQDLLYMPVNTKVS